MTTDADRAVLVQLTPTGKKLMPIPFQNALHCWLAMHPSIATASLRAVASAVNRVAAKEGVTRAA